MMLKNDLAILILGVCMMAIGGVSGCMEWNTLHSSANTLFQPIHRQHLVEYEHRIAHLKQHGVKGEALEVAHQWLYLMGCHPFPTDLKRPQSPLWKALYESLILETLRGPKQLGHLALFDQRFNRTLPSLNESQWTRWPKNPEGWPDEMPDYVTVASQCKQLSQGYPQTPLTQRIGSLKKGSRGWVKGRPSQSARVKKGKQKAKRTPKNTFFTSWPWTALRAKFNAQGWTTLKRHIHLWGQLSRTLLAVQTLQKTLKSPSPLVDEWTWWLTYTQAQLLSQWSKVESGWPAPAEIPLFDGIFLRKSCEVWEKLHPTSALSPPLALTMKRGAQAQSEVALMVGLCRENKGLKRQALKAWAQVDSSQFEGDVVYLTQYHRVRVLSQLNEWKAILKLRDQAPPTQSKLFSPYVYLVGLAYSRLGDDAGLMGFATDLFRDRGWRKDPFLRALFYLFLRGLTRYTFEDRVIELLEDLGPRYETYERVFAFAQVALDEGEPRQAEEAAYWLLNHHENAQWTPRYESILALVAFFNNQPTQFEDALERISPLDSTLLDAVVRGRRSQFFAEQDRALVDVMRAVIPQIAELDRTQMRLKNKWLNTLTRYIQRFLRVRKESKARGDLTHLYRMSRQMLARRFSRSYSERIGKKQVDTLVLGQVRVESTQLDPFEPRAIQIRFQWPWTFTLIPSLAFSPLKWTFTWKQ